jgi:antitoxin component HigA of HigAB toxin-antitoxin module
MTSMNVPLMLQEHGKATVEDLDREIRSTTERLAVLCQRRAIVLAHIALGQAFGPLPEEVGHEALG